MFADADHEVIDSPEALFRHLYEEHGVEEARDLDPETAPVQFWLRRHGELERAERAARRPDPAPPPTAPPQTRPERAAREEPTVRGEPTARPEPPAQPEPAARGEPTVRPEPAPRPRADPQAQPGPRAQPDNRRPAAARTQPAAGGREGRRHAGFGDPLLEAVTRAMVGRGHDEAAVRSAIRSFPAAASQPAGEAGVRAAFVEPMLQAVADHLLGPGGPRRPRPAGAAPVPPRAAAPPAPDPAPPQPARPEAAWAVLWADLADSGRRTGDGEGPAGDEGDDLMAVANAVQARRRVRLLRR
jgi:hypothetical protein